MRLSIRPGTSRSLAAAGIVTLVALASLVVIELYGSNSRTPTSESSSATSISTSAASSTSRTTTSTTTTGRSTTEITTTATTVSSTETTTHAANYTFVPPTFYVATDGNDAWSGILATPNPARTDGPFATLTRAQNAVGVVDSSSPGRSTPIGVEIEGGTYNLSSTLTFTSADSGSASAPVIYEAAPSSTVVISGGKQVTGWTLVSGNEWATSASGLQYFEQMWKDGQRIFRPSTTNGSYLYVASTVYSTSKSPNCSVQLDSKYECFDRFQFAPGDIQASYYDIGNVEIDIFECWTMPVLHLKSVDTANNTAFLSGPTTRNSGCHGFINGHRYLVVNDRDSLAPGQWYFDAPNDQILYMARPGENPNTEAFIAPQLQTLLQFQGAANVEFEGVTFSYANWVVPATGWVSPQGEELSPLGLPAAVNASQSSLIQFVDDTFSHLSAYALAFDGTLPFQPSSSTPYDDEVVGGTIYDVGGGGVVIGEVPFPSDTDSGVAQHVLVWNTEIAHIGRFLPGSNGVYILNSHDNLVGHDLIFDTYSNAISVGGTYEYNIKLPQLAHGNVVEYNLVYDINQGVMDDGGALYTASGTAQGNVIQDNVVHDVVADLNATIKGYGGWGIYFDSTSQNVVARDNLVYRTSFPSIHQNDGFNNTVTNNILAFGGEGLIDRTHDNASSLFVSHNIFYYDASSVSGSMQRGTWRCFSFCQSQFQFSSNLYWYTQGSPVFFTGTSFSPQTMTFAQWQALGEDQGSEVANPLFADPQQYNFTLSAGSPALAIGFVPFSPSAAGLLRGTSYELPPVPQAFTRIPLPSSDF